MSGRRFWATLAATLACVAVLGTIGLGVEDHLHPTSLSVPGTSSARGQALAEAHFGDSSPFTVLLRGPAGAIEHQGPELVAALRRAPGATVLSPWDRGAISSLRPSPRKALILLDLHLPLVTAIRHAVTALEATLAAHVHPPLRATQSGFATISRALQRESIAASERAELIAVPLLLLVLLLVFRSLIAAAIPLVLGALTVLAGRGVLVLLTSFVNIDALSLIVCTMMGLALGVDYSLLIVSRFREELAGGRQPAQAARVTRRSAGRTIAFAGSTLFTSILLSAFIQPGSLLASFAVALAVVTLISVVIAWGALPALLALLGPRIGAGRLALPRRRRAPAPVAGPGRSEEASGSRVAAAAAAALRRPALAMLLIAVPLVLLAAPALAFNTGAPGVDELPAGSPARRSAEAIDAAVGPGWEAPFVLLAASERGPITAPARLALLGRWQRRILAEPGVRAVIGPAPIAHTTRPLRRLGRRLVSSGPQGPARLARLGPRMHQASLAVTRLRSGIARAAAGSGLLAAGSGRAGRGAGLFAAGLDRATAAGRQAIAALGRLAAGSERLAAGQHRAAAASLSLALGLRSLLPALRSEGVGRAQDLAAKLEAAAREDPALAPEAEEARQLARSLALDRNEVRQLRGIAIPLNTGLGQLGSASDRLEAGSRRFATTAGALQGHLQQLGGGAASLADGLQRLQGGAGSLQRGLAAGFHRSYPLQAGLRRAAVRISATSAPLLAGTRRLQRTSPRLFDSGYLVLSALDGAPAPQRALAGEAVDVDGGGGAARMLIVPNAPLNSPGSRQVGARLRADAAQLAKQGGLKTGVAGGAALLNDYGTATKARIPLVVGAIVLVTFLLLLAILRAPVLAALVVGLNLVSVGAAIGAVTLICEIPAGYPLGGHPYLDTVGAASIFGVTFGLSIDYALFLIARIRERYERDGDNRAAIQFGLERTAGVITGAAAIMTAVFVSFAAAPIATISQLGAGLTVAILLDATLVRIVLLPALMLLLGDRVWRAPHWLDRLLPHLNVHGPPVEAAET